MAAMRTYGQYCGLAKALDHVGDRWTLLIVRELLVGPRRYSELRRALPGIATNLLADRLQQLECDGIAARHDGLYTLTTFGHALEEAVHALVRWGGRWMTERDSTEAFDPRWLVVALRALLPARRHGSIQLEIEGASLRLTRSTVDVGRLDAPDAIVEGSAHDLLGVLTGQLSLSCLRVHGDRDVAAAVLGVP